MLKSTAVRGVLWSAIDKFAVQASQFAVSILLARLLVPEDFGLIGMLAIFIAISQAFIESGLGSGLIQRQERTDQDFSTLFIFNLAVSATLYIGLFIASPYVAQFFKEPQLVNLLRVLSLNLIVIAFSIVQRTKLTINLDFKSIAKSNLIGVVVGGFGGILAAINGCGVWSLVYQILAGSLASCIALWFLSSWKASVYFSKDSFRSLFGYGSKLLLAGLYAQVMNNVYNVFLGKYYSSIALGYYSRAKNLADVSAGTISSALQQVTFPMLASVQHDRDKVVLIYSKMIRLSGFVIIPFMTLIALQAKPIVLVLLTEKWVLLIPLLQWMVFSRIFLPLSVINMNLLNAIGRSDLFLKVDLSKFPITVIAMIITIPLGVKAIVIGHVITAALSYLINAYLPGKFYGYGALHQLRDMLPVVGATVLMSICVIVSTFLIHNLVIQLFLGSAVGFVSYMFSCRIFKIKEYNEIKQLVQKLLSKKEVTN
ncbi:lipopolysaccharide biosynthesis protein [Flavobacterium faecale]|uniref:Lipopolysaccharide biosynthesis protein n=1 Tax=Flavobacterium faecale TaxID=1355330 RepID=A0A2S1LDA8_9FLAO|nr:lipopolysaccharide biosynthesis protein [Flavobacterium faecale]AWG21698.1 lipopolysaccharide biosynthesis protein [Flavobacterium faecale]